MDLITHTLSGVAAGTVLASYCDTKKQMIASITLGGLGGALPDLDAISLWSHFDSTFGKWFGLSDSGASIYSAKFWYSHHGFMHSIAAALCFSALIYFFLNKRSTQKKALLPLSFFSGFIIHLFEDMPTPASMWGGVNLLWPSGNYIGGFGKIWWWNNYDIFLIVLLLITLNGIVLITISKRIRRPITTIFFIIGLLAILYQINSRPYNFAYTGHTKNYAHYEQNSKNAQKKILGETIYNLMVRLDNAIPLYF